MLEACLLVIVAVAGLVWLPLIKAAWSIDVDVKAKMKMKMKGESQREMRGLHGHCTVLLRQPRNASHLPQPCNEQG